MRNSSDNKQSRLPSHAKASIEQYHLPTLLVQLRWSLTAQDETSRRSMQKTLPQPNSTGSPVLITLTVFQPSWNFKKIDHVNQKTTHYNNWPYRKQVLLPWTRVKQSTRSRQKWSHKCNMVQAPWDKASINMTWAQTCDIEKVLPNDQGLHTGSNGRTINTCSKDLTVD